MEKEKYLVFADHKFSKEADRELQRIFSTLYKGEKAGKSDQFFMARIVGNRKEAMAAIKANKLAFVDAVIPIDAVLAATGNDYDEMIDATRKLLGKDKTFKIEVKRINSDSSDGAKSIEVKIGSALESEGFGVDLENPEKIVYVILLGGKTVIGAISRDQADNYVLDRFRSEQNETEQTVNRAEFKLEEAVEFFGVDLSDARRALDIGASPGGWTHYLVTKGVKVVAVDNALLNYEKICQAGKALVLASRDELRSVGNALKEYGVVAVDIDDADIRLDDYDVIQIKANAQHIGKSLLDHLGRFDMLTIDTNTEAKDSAGIADSLAGTLNTGAHLIMTIKFFNRSITKQIAAAEEGLSNSYDKVAIKKLPHNRDELTLHATKR